MTWTPYKTAGIIVIIIGVILLIAGVIELAIDQSNQTTSEWWVWGLIVIGVIALLVGICLFFIPAPLTPLEERLQRQDPCMPPSMADPCAPLPPQPVDPCAKPKMINVVPVKPDPCAPPPPADPCATPVINVKRVC